MQPVFAALPCRRADHKTVAIHPCNVGHKIVVLTFDERDRYIFFRNLVRFRHGIIGTRDSFRAYSGIDLPGFDVLRV